MPRFKPNPYLHWHRDVLDQRVVVGTAGRDQGGAADIGIEDVLDQRVVIGRARRGQREAADIGIGGVLDQCVVDAKNISD